MLVLSCKEKYFIALHENEDVCFECKYMSEINVEILYCILPKGKNDLSSGPLCMFFVFLCEFYLGIVYSFYYKL